MSDTPRTDAMIPSTSAEWLVFARSLERELSACRAVALELRDACQYLGTIEADTKEAYLAGKAALAKAKGIGL